MPLIEMHELEAMPTLSVGQAADLKIDTTTSGGVMRVWLSRCGIADGETQPVRVERWDEENARWEDITEDGERWGLRSVSLDGAYSGYRVPVLDRKPRRES
jgi:hypothetical protein